MVETVPPARAPELACRLGHEQEAEIMPTQILKVPPILSVNAAMPPQEVAGLRTLEVALVTA
jgi:hypothetical protein